MKYFIISDIHGDLYYLNKMIEIFDQGKYKKMIILGDILYHGPRNDLPNNYNPKGCIEKLNMYKDKIIAVKGNCDAEVDQMVLSFKIRNSYNLKYKNYLIHFEHGHHIIKNEKKYNMIITGHTHIPKLFKKDNIIYANPGSISIPKENSSRCFIEIEKGMIRLININLKIEKQIMI